MYHHGRISTAALPIRLVAHRMTIALALGMALIALALTPARADSIKKVFNFNNTTKTVNYAREYGATPPPTGWVSFCHTNPQDCNVRAGYRVRVKLDRERWSELKRKLPSRAATPGTW